MRTDALLPVTFWAARYWKPYALSLEHGTGRVTYCDGDRIKPWKDIGGEDLIQAHACEDIPEVPKRLGVLHLLPMKSLECLHRGHGTPVGRLNMPNGDWS